jgi:hypothetical protein
MEAKLASQPTKGKCNTLQFFLPSLGFKLEERQGEEGNRYQ